MKVIRNYLYNAGYQVLAIIVPLITSPYISRVLHASGVGDNAYTNSIIQYFVMFAALGVGYYGNREIAYVRENRQKMSETFWEIQILKTLTTLGAYLAFVIFVQIYTDYSWYLWVQSINVIAVAFDISWLFMGLEDFKRTVIRNTIVKISSLICIFAFVRDANDVALYIFIVGASTLFGNLILWPYLKGILVPVKWRSLHPLKHFNPTVSLFIPQVATSVYLQLNKTMLGAMIGADYSGFYYNADQIVKMVLTLATSLGTVMLPHMASAFAKGDHKRVNEMLYTSFDFISLLSVAMSFGLAAVSLHLGPYFFGKGFGPVGPAMLIESVVILLIAWSNTVGAQYLLPTNKVKAFTTSVVLGAIVNAIANLPFIYFWGLNGAMYATVLSELVVTGYQLWYVRKLVSMKKLFTNVYKYLFAGIVMFIPVFLIDNAVKTSVISLALEVILGIVIYVVMILILRPTSLLQVKEMIGGRLKGNK
ncbi:flippase [Ligilactobacillus apodemi]|uniref:Oligosaccharide translocase n=1 Tax=Ligilactobacillus apodemi DSM 16634 = JCM 16172 TaxID=1423724 RepID=A0A0R1U3D6_9LACO|nr:flippase [Ligilactobacillus apodemi]KRL87470.1 oligosaccharide translocase [Ligilactobacillus apodemi DSM 16634 = JCM 16172]MBD5068695.1 flippase [Lactobacillus sp.]MCR1901944.1 flippase [Ligilactobacillus apodemi]